MNKFTLLDVEPVREQNNNIEFIKKHTDLRTQNNIVDSVEKDQKQVRILENKNRIHNIKNCVMNEEN